MASNLLPDKMNKYCIYHLHGICSYGIHCLKSHEPLSEDKALLLKKQFIIPYKAYTRACKCSKNRKKIIEVAQCLGYNKEIVTNYLHNKGRGNDSKNGSFVNHNHENGITIDDFILLKKFLKKCI